MKKVNWGVIAVVITLSAALLCVIVDIANDLVALGEMNENLMGRMYDMPDEY